MLNPPTTNDLLAPLAGFNGNPDNTNSLPILTTSPGNGRSGTQLVFVDRSVADYQFLAKNTLAGANIVFLDPARDQISQITETLEQYDNVAGLHIISHGSSGQLSFGSSTVNLQTLNQRSTDLQTWAKALTPDADILLYGCLVGEGEAGQAFITELAKLTGADIAASTDLTGNSDLGGDWTLEASTGAIDIPIIFNSAVLASYSGVLPTFTYADFSSIAGLDLNGVTAQAGTALRLTPAASFQAGSAFLDTPLTITADTSFQTQFQFRLTGGTGGADGFTFMLQNSAAGAGALGELGGSLGYDTRESPTGSRIVNSLAIEFDTFANAWDTDGNHISVLRDGDVTTPLATTSVGVPELNSGDLINTWVEYDGVTNRLDVYVSTSPTRPATPTLSHTIDLATVVGTQAFAGFSAGTGGLFNAHDITSWTLTASTDTTPPPPDTAPPTAVATAAPLTIAGTSPYTFTVTYTDNVAVDATSIGGTGLPSDSDIAVTNAAGVSQLATLVSVTPAGSGPVRTATYRISPPGGTWDSADNGLYTIALRPSQVRDINGNFALAADIGSFTVTIPTTPPSGATISFPDFSSITGLDFNGVSSRAGTALRLTPASGFQVGSAFFDTPLTITADTSFQTQFQFRITGGTSGSDGFTFMLQNSPAGAGAIGERGGSLGYDIRESGTGSRIVESLAIEFDTFANPWDTNGNHISVLRDGDVTTPLATTPIGVPDLNSGDLINTWIEYDGATNRLDIYVSTSPTRPATPTLSHTVDLAEVVGAQAFAGFSAGTGGGFNAHDITSWTLSTSTGTTPPPVDTAPPTAAATATTLTTAGTSPYTFTVTYTDNVAVDATSISGTGLPADSDIAVTNAAGVSQLATLVSVTPAGSGPVRTATYRISPPGGTWDSADNGLYTIALRPSQVRDINGNFALAADIGSFTVTIPTTPPSGATISFPDFSSVAGLDFNGVSGQAGTALRITPAAGFQGGSAFFDTPLTIAADTSFQTQFQFRLTGGTTGADGFTFMLQNSPAAAGALGELGGNLGYDSPGFPGARIVQSLAIEFDTYRNAWDTNDNHISVLRDGDVTTALATTAVGVPDLNGGDLINAWIDYDGTTDELDIYLSADTTRPETPTLSHTIDLASVVGARAFAGFSAGTGGLFNAHDITSWTLNTTTGPLVPASRIALRDNATIFVSEGAGFATVTAIRTGNIQERVTFEYTTNELGGTGVATANVDYLQPTFGGRPNTGQVVFEIGETEVSFTIPIIDDALPEGNESFAIGLQNPSSGSLGAPRTVLITIIDNDVPNTVSFTAPAVSVSEGGSTVTLIVERTGDISGTATVDFVTSNGTAIAGSDYTATSGTLTFGPNQLTRTISIPVLEDLTIEGNETFTVTLSNPVGVGLGSQTTSTVTILDNDLALGTLIRRTAVTGLSEPTTIDWTPDGRYMLVAQKNGVVRVVDNGILRSTPLVDISDQVNGTRDRGLLGLAIHPQFPTVPYVYLAYTYDDPVATAGLTGLAGPDGSGNRPSRLSRVEIDPVTMQAIPGTLVTLVGSNSTWAFTSRPDLNSTGDDTIPPSGIVNGTTIVAPPELIEFGLQDNDPLTPGIQNGNIRDYMAMDSESHTIGQVVFGPDGYLYLTNGDGTSYNFMDPRTVRVQDLSNLSGKVIRIDPITGAAAPGNPFFDPGDDPFSNRARVFQYGLRNPFRFTFDPVTSLPVIGDVGWSSWEEINTGPAGANFGWPYFEGPDGAGAYSGLSLAQAFYANGNRNVIEATTPPTFDAPAVLPILPRRHGAPDFASSIMVGDFYNSDTLMFGDIYGGTLFAATLDASRQITAVQVFDSSIPFIVDLEMGPDGLLYGVDLVSGTILRWTPA